MESDLIFNNILPKYKSIYNIVVSLHDGIYTLNNLLSYNINNIFKYINNIYNNIKYNIIYYNIYYLSGVNCWRKLVPT